MAIRQVVVLKKILSIITFFFVFLTTSAALSFCNTYEEVKARLSNKYHENNILWGLDHNNNLLEIYVSNVGAWTMVITTPGCHTKQPCTCVLHAGDNLYVNPKKIMETMTNGT